MAPEPLKTITCPACSNINPTSVDECLKCNMDLKPVKAALAAQGLIPVDPGTNPPPIKQTRTRPPIPDFRIKGKEDLGQLVESELLLIRGKAANQDDLIAYFFQQLIEHDIPSVEICRGSLIVEKQERDYFFIQKYLEEKESGLMRRMTEFGEKANNLLGSSGSTTNRNMLRPRATMAVRIFASGKDLMVEWRNYVRTSQNLMSITTSMINAVSTYGVSLIGDKGRDSRLHGFANQDNAILQLGVRAALEEAVDLVGIEHNLIQNTAKNSSRLI